MKKRHSTSVVVTLLVSLISAISLNETQQSIYNFDLTVMINKVGAAHSSVFSGDPTLTTGDTLIREGAK